MIEPMTKDRLTELRRREARPDTFCPIRGRYTAPFNGYTLDQGKELIAEIDRLKAEAEKLPSIENIDVAIRHIEESIGSHESWREWREKGGGGDPQCGDIKHHKQCLLDYAQVMQTLVATREAVDAAKGQS